MQLKREIIKKWHILEEKKKNTTDPKKSEELTIAIQRCKMVLAHNN